ncbi:MAG: hypothetical protein AB7F59_06970 [Bdellovibrionales bacterium]
MKSLLLLALVSVFSGSTFAATLTFDVFEVENISGAKQQLIMKEKRSVLEKVNHAQATQQEVRGTLDCGTNPGTLTVELSTDTKIYKINTENKDSVYSLSPCEFLYRQNELIGTLERDRNGRTGTWLNFITVDEEATPQVRYEATLAFIR